MRKLGPAELYLISVIGMDDDYEPLDTIGPIFTPHVVSDYIYWILLRETNERLLREIKLLENDGYVRAYKYRGIDDDSFHPAFFKSYRDASNLWFKLTARGRLVAREVDAYGDYLLRYGT